MPEKKVESMMGKSRIETRNARRSRLLLIFGVISLAAIIALLVVPGGIRMFAKDNLPAGTETPVEKQKDSIAIPGYESLTLAAGTRKQTLSLQNPPQNTCYFQISLFLEDGTLLWQSELIKPGRSSKPIVLEQTLEAGTYPKAILRYACFEMDKERKPLNGAEIKVTLRVK